MARKNRNPKVRGWYVKTGDPPGTERFWDGEKWGPQPRIKRGAETQEAKQPAARRKRSEPATEEEAEQAPDAEDQSPVPLQSSVWARISARSADMVVVILPWYFIWVRAFSTEESIVDGVVTETTVLDQTYIWAAVSFLVVYEVGFIRWWGATPGKRLTGLKIIDRETLAPPGWGRALLRTVPMVLVTSIILAPLLWLVCVVLMARDRLQRSAFDFSGGTLVVIDPDRQSRLAQPRRPRRRRRD